MSPILSRSAAIAVALHCVAVLWVATLAPLTA
jgi:hypothetical protein